MSVDRNSLNPKRKKAQKQSHEPKTARSPENKINLDYFSRAIEKSLKKTKPKKKGSRNQSYKSCLSLTKLQRLAQDQNKNIVELLKQKEELIRENETLHFYTKNNDVNRESYFLEEIQRKNLEILYIETKMKESKQKNKTAIINLKKQINKLQSTLAQQAQQPRHHRRQQITPLK